MKNICLLLLLFLSLNLLGQEPSKSFDIKLYTNFDYTPKYLYHETDTMNGSSIREYEKEINCFNFSPALAFHGRKGNSSEIELSRLRYANNYSNEYSVIDSSGAEIDEYPGNYKKEFESYIRYEYKLHLFKKKDWETIKPILGFSATPFFQWNKSEPLLSNEYTSSNTSEGLYLSIVPSGICHK